MFQVDRDVLLRPVKVAQAGMLTRNVMPILSHVLLELDEHGMTATGTDTGMQVTARALVEHGNGTRALAVPAQKLHAIVHGLPAGAVIGLDLVDDNRLRLESGGSKYRLRTLPVEDFPRMSQDPGEVVEVTLPQKELRRLLARTHYVMPAKGEVRWWLVGSLLMLGGGRLAVTASDDHRMAWAAAELPQDTPRVEVLLPRKATIELHELLTDDDEPVKVRLYQTRAVFEFAGIELVTALLDGVSNFPRHHERSLTCSRRFLIERLPLLQALQRIGILTSKYRGASWTLEPGRLRLEVVNGTQEDAEEILAIEYTGEPANLGFNIDYVADALSAITTDTVEIQITDLNTAMVIIMPGTESFRCAIATMRV